MDDEQKTHEHAHGDREEFSDFNSVYANNSRFETSVWDLKTFFGQLEQHSGNAEIDWHTAVTMPWMQAKVFCYFLRLNLLFHEIQNGRIAVHRNVMPPKPVPPTPEELEKDPGAKALHENVSKIYAEMFG